MPSPAQLDSLAQLLATRTPIVVIETHDERRLTAPPELVRKGRFDEIIFVDLPDSATREAILRIHLGRHRIDVDDAGLAALAVACERFAGAEIEAAVLAARYEAHALGQPASTSHVRAELGRTKPLSVTRAEAIGSLRAWAVERTVSAD